MNRRNAQPLILLAVVAAALAAIVGWRAYQARHPNLDQLAHDAYLGDPDTWPAHQKFLGHPAPPLDLTEWRGTPVTPETMKGKIVVVDFWAVWCEPCLQSVPHNNEVAKKYADKGVIVVGACGAEEQEKMKAVADEVKMEYPTGRASDKTTTAWGVQFWPHIAVLDRQGKVRAVGIKPDALETVLDALLRE